MDQINYETRRQEALDLKCKKTLPGAEKSGAVPHTPVKTTGIVLNPGAEIASLTPQKTTEHLHAKIKDQDVNLPDKYKMIAELFNCMNCSLRLLVLSKKSTTFQNICTQVEILSKRKFLYSHLAQIKYLLPEFVQIDYILVHDAKTLCMKPDMKISLMFDVIEGHQEQFSFRALHQVFAHRLSDFFNTHPKGCDIPEAILPEPFNQRTQDTTPKSPFMDSSKETQPTSEFESLTDSSHLNPSFSRHFSQRTVVVETGRTQLLPSPVPLLYCSSDIVTIKVIKSEQHKESSEFYSESTIMKPPIGLSNPQSSINSSACESPFLKAPMVSDSLMVETPAQMMPKRSMPSRDKKLKIVTKRMGISCQMPTKRSLDFSSLEGDESTLKSILNKPECDIAIYDTVSRTTESKGINVEDEAFGVTEHLQKLEENSDRTGNAHTMRQRSLVTPQQLASLVDLVALIHRIFLSINCFSITKEELVHKIIMNCDTMERREIEEQIELLEKQVPEWIFCKLAPSGDLLYSIKESNLDSVCARLCNL